MFQAMLSASSGLDAQQYRMDTIADNMANVNTTGFKGRRVDFKDALYTAGDYPYADETQNLQQGHGVIVAAASRNEQAGTLLTTDRLLDFAIEGDGYFQLQLADGSSAYSRAGSFYISYDGASQFNLVNAQGYFLVDNDGAPVTVPDGNVSLTVSPEGVVTFSDGSEVQLAIRSFAHTSGLESVGGSLLAETESSGPAVQAANFRLRQGALESSNVDLANEMALLVRTQRAFSLASRALTTADDMEGVANNLRR